MPLARLPAARADTVVVTLMDRPVARGTTDAEATQYFGVYTLDGDACVPEPF